MNHTQFINNLNKTNLSLTMQSINTNQVQMSYAGAKTTVNTKTNTSMTNKTSAIATATPATTTDTPVTNNLARQQTIKHQNTVIWNNQDLKQRVTTLFTFGWTLFGITMASLLSVFVPQRCSPDPENGFPEHHSCTEQENFGLLSPLTRFEMAVLVWNFITLASTLIHYAIVYHREVQLIKYLDVSVHLPLDNLTKEICKYSDIKLRLYRVNLTMFISSISLIVFFVTNAIMSGIMIFGNYYDGFRTVTVYLTNLALMVNLLKITSFHAYIGYKTDEALSCFNLVPVSFNTIDRDYVNSFDLQQVDIEN